MPKKKATPTKNLVRNVKEISRQAKIVTSKKKQAQNKLSSKRSYTLRELPLKQQSSVKNYLLELEQKAGDLESLKRPGEMWYFTMFGNRSRLYDSLELAAPSLLEWAMSAQQPSHGSQTNDDLIHGIKLFKFKGRGIDVRGELSDTEFEKQEQQFDRVRQRAREKHRMEKAEKIERVKAVIAPQRKKGQPKPSTYGLLSSTFDALLKAQAQLQKQQRQINRLLKQLTPPKAAAKKKAPAKKGKKK